MQLFSIPERKTGPPRNERGQETTIFLKMRFGVWRGDKKLVFLNHLFYVPLSILGEK